MKNLEEEIIALERHSKTATVSLETIIDRLSGKGRPLILILLSLPFCLPVQIPGLSTPFGLMIAFIAIRAAFGKRIWLPQWLLSKRISSHTLKKITRQSLKIIRKIKPWIHPRLRKLCHAKGIAIINGLLVSLLGITLALPLPIPLSNLTAAWSIFLISLGVLEDDGLFVLFGYCITLTTLLFFIIITLFTAHHLF